MTNCSCRKPYRNLSRESDASAENVASALPLYSRLENVFGVGVGIPAHDGWRRAGQYFWINLHRLDPLGLQLPAPAIPRRGKLRLRLRCLSPSTRKMLARCSDTVETNTSNVGKLRSIM
jgi:hypothetical protein